MKKGDTMKVAINKCWGGFGLSHQATKRLAELEGRQCFFFKNARKENGEIDLDHLIPIETDKLGSEFMWYAYDVPNPDEVLPSRGKEWNALSQEEKRRCNEEWSEHSLYYGRMEGRRSDPLLIQALEELGDEANGKHAEIHIIEIPDGVDYEIDEYDGMETIHEKHRSWG